MEAVLFSHAAHHFYFSDILERTWSEYESEDEVTRTLSPDDLDAQMRESTQWLSQRLSG